MFQRSAFALARRSATSFAARRPFTAAAVKRASGHGHGEHETKAVDTQKNFHKRLEEIDSTEDLLPPGAKPGTIPSDLEQATGLERLEILGKMQGVDIFDMKPLPSDRVGTMKDPIFVKSMGDEQYCGCTGCPADSHHVRWITISRERPLGRCDECGSCYMMEYVGPPDDPEHDHPPLDAYGNEYVERKTFADFVKPEYYYGR